MVPQIRHRQAGRRTHAMVEAGIRTSADLVERVEQQDYLCAALDKELVDVQVARTQGHGPIDALHAIACREPANIGEVGAVTHLARRMNTKWCPRFARRRHDVDGCGAWMDQERGTLLLAGFSDPQPRCVPLPEEHQPKSS